MIEFRNPSEPLRSFPKVSEGFGKAANRRAFDDNQGLSAKDLLTGNYKRTRFLLTKPNA